MVERLHRPSAGLAFAHVQPGLNISVRDRGSKTQVAGPITAARRRALDGGQAKTRSNCPKRRAQTCER